MKYDAVIFDLDGTLLDTLADLCDSVNAALSACGYPVRTLDEVRRFVGNGIRLLVERAVPEGTEKPEADRVFAAFKADYAVNCERSTAPYPGTEQLLEKLKADGIPAAIVSNKADFAVKKLSERYFGKLIAVAVGEREGIARKPSPDTVFEVVKSLGCKNPLYVGDSEVDVATADAAGIDGAFVTWGFRTTEVLRGAGAKTLCGSAEELYRIITQGENNARS